MSPVTSYGTTNRDLEDLERHMREEHFGRSRRGEFCALLGISQSRLRRQLEAGPDAKVPRTLALAMAALATGLEPFVHGRLARRVGGASEAVEIGDQESEAEAPHG